MKGCSLFSLKAEFDVLTSINQGEIRLNFHKLGKKWGGLVTLGHGPRN